MTKKSNRTSGQKNSSPVLHRINSSVQNGHSCNASLCGRSPAIQLQIEILDRGIPQKTTTAESIHRQMLAIFHLQGGSHQAKKGEWIPGLASPGYLALRKAEFVNGRWAMLGVDGMLLPEVLPKISIINAPPWYDAGKAEYFVSYSTLFVIEFILFHYEEIRRWQEIKNPGSVNQDPIFKSYSLPPNEVGYSGPP
ncbi:hypothetical protein ZIOFF_041214 [Zingiber officinale]|uniref:Chlorophyll a-b binding protein, chloroplastic n=1 Tax=Zingiber officinale TaxID=94328 RepID=A0A8J5G4K8_ZINOF|nr:hypothetical protein ZIOFF_041214 [Zingiber officinale]